MVTPRNGKLAAGHLEAAVADDADDRKIGARTPEELERGLAKALSAPGPTVIEAVVDPAHYAQTVYD